MKPSLTHIKAAAAILFAALSTVSASAHSAGDLPLEAGLSESGKIELPPGAAQSMWLDFYTSINVAPATTAKLRGALERLGYKFAISESAARVAITVSGYARIRNEAGSYDTGKVFLGEILEQNVSMGGQSATATVERGVHLDAGVMQQASRAITASGHGGSNAVAAGAGVALLSDWLADVSGLRGALNGAFSKAVGAKGDRPLICFGACKRTVHEVVIDLSVWQGKVPKTYTLTVSRQADDIEEELIPPLAESALTILLERLSEVAPS